MLLITANNGVPTRNNKTKTKHNAMQFCFRQFGQV